MSDTPLMTSPERKTQASECGEFGSSPSSSAGGYPSWDSKSSEHFDYELDHNTSGKGGFEVVLGGKYHVKRKDDDGKYMWALATVMDERSRSNVKDYYIHYEGRNKRLDEWVTIDRFYQTAGKIPMDCDLNVTATDLGDSPSDPVEREREALTKIKYIECIQLGKYEIDTWYFSPYPDDYGYQRKLFICEYCLMYMKLEETYKYHLGHCSWKSPPGRNIYESKKQMLTIFEVDPSNSLLYSQNLCLLAKLFLDHKTIFFDVEPFLFYVLCELDDLGAHIVGFFSKEKKSPEGNNVACILILPPFQRQGYGKFLIGFSYELSRIVGIPGSPEKPLSDLGRLSYYSYWTWTILDILRRVDSISVAQISDLTYITEEDILECLKYLNLVKHWTEPDTLHIPSKSLLKQNTRPPHITVDSCSINWEP